jgi:hypothetical protein
MGKRSREKRERREAIRLGKLDPSQITEEEKRELEKDKAKEDKKQQQKDIKKYSILANLKVNWKPNVKLQYKTEPDKIRNTNIEKNAKDIYNNITTKPIFKLNNISIEDIVEILTEIRDEVISEAEGK